ncbi:MAG: metalloregulator ArsR/SmtB family transcription factor [Candidatus Margulisiibacteriota bacterium]
MKQLYELHAEICKTLGNPKRIELINLLRGGELSVAELLQDTGLLKANLSQHLAVMRSKGIVKARKEGLSAYYRIANPKIVKACDLMRAVLFESMKERQKVLKKWGKKNYMILELRAAEK